MATADTLINNNSPKINERIFLLCDRCLWTSTCINKKYLEELSEISESELSCPVCNQDNLSSFPIAPNDSFTYCFSEDSGLEMTFRLKN